MLGLQEAPQLFGRRCLSTYSVALQLKAAPLAQIYTLRAFLLLQAMSSSLRVCRSHKVIGVNSVLNYRICCFCRNPARLCLSETGPHVTQQNPTALAAAMEFTPTTTLFKVWVTLCRHVHRPGKDIRCHVRSGDYELQTHFVLDGVMFSWKSSRYYCDLFHMDRQEALREPIDQLATSFRNIIHKTGGLSLDMGDLEFGPCRPVKWGRFPLWCEPEELEADLAAFREFLFSPTKWTLELFDETGFPGVVQLKEQRLMACLRLG